MNPPSNCSQQHQGYTGYPKPLMSSGDDHRTKSILAQEADFFLFLPVSGPLLSASLALLSSPLFAFSAARISALPSSTLLLASALRFEICRASKLKTYGTHDMVFHSVWLNLFKIMLLSDMLALLLLNTFDFLPPGVLNFYMPNMWYFIHSPYLDVYHPRHVNRLNPRYFEPPASPVCSAWASACPRWATPEVVVLASPVGSAELSTGWWVGHSSRGVSNGRTNPCASRAKKH